ncbi:MAG: NAD-dependent epimerase/dehydratase family protein [Acidimicrobiia bacterium]
MVSFVTGATGFIGRRLVDGLADAGHKVRALVRDPARAQFLDRPGVELVQGDLGDPASLNEAVTGTQRVFHCAGLVGDWLRPEETRRINVEGTRALLSACASAGVERVVYLSSLSVYGLGHHHGTDESAPHRYSGETYIDSKIDAERMVRVFMDRDGPETVILRPGFVYGPGDHRFMPRLLDALARRQFMYIGDGSKVLNIGYVDDVVQAALLADSTHAAAGHAYNLTDGTETSLRTFVEFVCQQLGILAPTKQIPPPLAWAACHGAEAVARALRAKEAPRINRGRMRFLYYNQRYCIDKARRELGYRPRFTYREGLPLTLAWFREQGLLPESLAEAPAPSGTVR